jgi:hypothetical protein
MNAVMLDDPMEYQRHIGTLLLASAPTFGFSGLA